MGRRRNKSSNKHKPKLTFTDSPDKEPIKVLCSPVCTAEHPVEATRILVNDISTLPWVSPQFNPLHFTEKNKCRRRRKSEPHDDIKINKKFTTNSKRFGRLQFENEQRVCMSKELGNKRKIGLELTFKKRHRRKAVKGDSDVSDIEISDQEENTNQEVFEQTDISGCNIAENIDNNEDVVQKDSKAKVLAYDTPERDYGIHVSIRRRRDLLPSCARQKLMDAVT